MAWSSSSERFSPNSLATLLKFFKLILASLSSSKSLKALRISSVGSLSLNFLATRDIYWWYSFSYWFHRSLGIQFCQCCLYRILSSRTKLQLSWHRNLKSYSTESPSTKSSHGDLKFVIVNGSDLFGVEKIEGFLDFLLLFLEDQKKWRKILRSTLVFASWRPCPWEWGRNLSLTRTFVNCLFQIQITNLIRAANVQTIILHAKSFLFIFCASCLPSSNAQGFGSEKESRMILGMIPKSLWRKL